MRDAPPPSIGLSRVPRGPAHVLPCVHFLPDDKTVLADPAETILQTSLRSGIPHTHACGGKARCSTCRVSIIDGLEHCSPRNVKERSMAERLRFSAGIRLACQTRVTGDVKLRRLVLDADDASLTDQRGCRLDPRLVGEEKRVAVLFADIRGFTAFAEQLPPYDVIHALNRYFCRMEEIIRSHGGYVDNYLGDGLLAIFGAGNQEAVPLGAVAAGIDMLEAVDKLEPYYASTYGQALRIGIGVHYGEVVLGSVGPRGRSRVTAIGDAVNFASRIESANKAARTRFLISSDTYRHVKERVAANRLEGVALPGRTHRCTLYEVTGIIAPHAA